MISERTFPGQTACRQHRSLGLQRAAPAAWNQHGKMKRAPTTTSISITTFLDLNPNIWGRTARWECKQQRQWRSPFDYAGLLFTLLPSANDFNLQLIMVDSSAFSQILIFRRHGIRKLGAVKRNHNCTHTCLECASLIRRNSAESKTPPSSRPAWNIHPAVKTARVELTL